MINGTNVPAVTPEPEIITSRTGTVTTLSENALTFTSPVYSDEKQLYEKVELRVQYTEATKFLEIDRRALPVPPVPGQPAQAPATREIDKAYLRIGDVVNVFAATNIRTERVFSVTEVRKILTR